MTGMKRAFRGLYGNRMIQFGNQVSFAENKSRRTWKPNVQKKTVFSETLQKYYKFRMTTYVIRCIKKAGGFDQYLLKAKATEIKYDKALAIKQQIIDVLKANRKAAQEVIARKPNEEGRETTEGELGESGELIDATAAVSSPLKPTGIAKFKSKGLLDLL